MANDSANEYQLPATTPPSEANIALAQHLCRNFLGAYSANVDSNLVSAPSTGWSRNALVQIKSTHGSWIVKVPRILSPESISACKKEGLQAQWAGDHGIGPRVIAVDDQTGGFIMPLLEACPLTVEEIVQRLPEVTGLLHRLHEQHPPKWFKPFSIFDLTRTELARAKTNSTLAKEDINIIQNVLKRAESIVLPCEQWVPCHNDFLNTNILSDKEGQLWCIDYEYAGLGDPLWDVGYLAVELKTNPKNVAIAYGLEKHHDQLKVIAYCNVAKVYSAVWCANRADGWHDFLPDYLDQVQQADQERNWWK